MTDRLNQMMILILSLPAILLVNIGGPWAGPGALLGLASQVFWLRTAWWHKHAALMVTAVSLWLDLNTVEWALIIASIALVFAGEMLNTVVELTIDLITQENLPVAKHAKDVAAGAILVAAIAAATIGFLVLGPRLWARLLALGLIRS